MVDYKHHIDYNIYILVPVVQYITNDVWEIKREFPTALASIRNKQDQNVSSAALAH